MDDDKLNRLERLAKLRADGILSDIEYDAEKAKVLQEVPPPVGGSSGIARPAEAPIDEARLAPIWQERFRFIDEHGMPGTKGHGDALRHVEFWTRSRLVMSLWAFFLAPLYFIYLGLWRPAISLFGASIVYSLILGMLPIPDWFDRVAWVIPSCAFALTCIPLYYLRVRRGIHDWNPLIWWRS